MPPRLDVRELRSDVLGPWSLSAARGEIIVLSGTSGSGKTRLLRAIADLDPCTGEVRLDGATREGYRPADWRGLVAYLSTDSRWWRDTAGEHFHPSEWTEPTRLGLPADVLAQPLSRLSSGERQRLALLRLLARNPRVLLLDEPTANLDSESTRLVEALLLDYRDHSRAAMLWVSHDPGQTTRLDARRLGMRAGYLEALAT